MPARPLGFEFHPTAASMDYSAEALPESSNSAKKKHYQFQNSTKKVWYLHSLRYSVVVLNPSVEFWQHLF